MKYGYPVLLALTWSGVLMQPALAADAPPRLEVAVSEAAPLNFIVYGDTRFTERTDVVIAPARQALVERIADEHPAAIFIGGDLVYRGDDAADYAAFRNETQLWSAQQLNVFPALGNHEFRTSCDRDAATSVCLENWWQTFPALRGFRWYSVSLGPRVLVLVLDTDSRLKSGSEQRRWLEEQIDGLDERVRFLLLVMHYPPVRDPIYPRSREEKEIERYLARRHASLHAQVVVIGSHVHNYERFRRDDVTYLVSGGGGAKPVPAFRMSGELSHLKTSTNFHYIRFSLDGARLTGTMVRYDPGAHANDPWSEPDRFEVLAGD
jgi:acid phosphatase type 7